MPYTARTTRNRTLRRQRGGALRTARRGGGKNTVGYAYMNKTLKLLVGMVGITSVIAWVDKYRSRPEIDVHVGDKVITPWDGRPYTATITEVHSNGVIDVTFDDDGVIKSGLSRGEYKLKRTRKVHGSPTK